MMLKLSKWDFKKILKEGLVGLLVLFVMSNLLSYLRKPTPQSSQLPSFETQTIEQRVLDSQSYREKPLVVHFWATWCPTCRLENSNIEEISQKYNVVTIAVNSGSDETLKQYMRENHLTFDVLNDESGEWAKQFNVEAFPTTFIYNSRGELSYTDVGYTTTVGLMARLALVH